MSILELIIIGFSLAMDAFAISVGKGLTLNRVEPRHALKAGVWFGGFQALMPIIGYLLGQSFSSIVVSIDHWIAFVLLGIIGVNMIREAMSGEEECADCSLSVKSMLPMAVATSIDALAIGVTLAFLNVNIWVAVSLIGIITFAISSLGVALGKTFGLLFKSKAEFFGGAVLIFIGLKILLEHLEILTF
jgi:putative Mn2+ efflux pump MntP